MVCLGADKNLQRRRSDFLRRHHSLSSRYHTKFNNR